MKKLLFLMMMGIMSFVWGSQEVTVQVISAVYEKSITREFDAKLKKTGLDIHKKVENGRYVVTLGAYPAEKSAQPALKKARHVVAKDAFVRLVNRAHTATAVQPVVHTNVQEHPAITEMPKSVEAPASKAIEAPKYTVSSPVIVQEIKQSAVAAKLSECDKKELRENAFTEAINYYKTSSYHRFEPIGLRQ